MYYLMNQFRIGVILLAGAVVVILLSYVAIGFVFLWFDVSSYSSTGITVNEPAYEAILENAEASGYSVERVHSSGFHPSNLDDLVAELGPSYEVFRVTLPYTESQQMWATMYADEGVTVITILVRDLREPFREHHLPPETWLIEQFMLLFEMDASSAENHVNELKEMIRGTDPGTPGAHMPQLSISEPVDFHSMYSHLTLSATTVTTNSTPGTGWHERHYYVNDSRIGSIDFVMDRSTITTDQDGTTYRITVDYQGGIQVVTETRGFHEISEEKVRHTLREIFIQLEVSPEAVDRLQFDYRDSVW